MKNIIVLSLALIVSFQLMAQQRRVSGTVVDSRDQSAMIGANIIEKGTANGTVTDNDGRFFLNLTTSNPVLVISTIGYKTVEVTVGNRSILNLEMYEDTELLDEVVVVGYGTMRKSDISGASVTVGEDAIRGSVITNLDQALQGRAAGVTSVMTSGAPGSSVSIRVRGQSTINANAEPLYVIDGVQYDANSSEMVTANIGNKTVSNPLSSLNPNDIESIDEGCFCHCHLRSAGCQRGGADHHQARQGW